MVHVAAAIIYNKENKILICQRKGGGSCGNLWEFPGGKLEANETPQACVLRECKEELNAEIELLEVYEECSHTYPENEIFFTFYKARLISDEIEMNVHQKMIWVKAEQLDEYPFCPADIEMIHRLKNEATFD